MLDAVSLPEWAAAAWEVTELASEDDRRWFQTNPDQEVRFRPPFVGEFPSSAWAPLPGELAGAGEHVRLVEVRLLGPGLRLCHLFWMFVLDTGSLRSGTA
jgi:hypothetical protein